MSDQFPFRCELDLSPLIEHWEELSENSSGLWADHARSVLGRVRDGGDVSGPAPDSDETGEREAVVAALLSALEAPGRRSPAFAAMVPWTFDPFYESARAKQLELPQRTFEHLTKTYTPDEVRVGMLLKAYGFVLEQVYGIDFGFELPFSWVSFRDVESTIPIECPMTGITRRFAIDFDPRFVRVDVVGEPPEIDAESVIPLARDPMGVPKLLELLPPHRFTFRGVTLLFAEDVTEEAALTAIRDDLLVKDALTSREGIEHIQDHVRAFMGRQDLELGLIGAGGGSDVDALVRGHVVGRSLLMNEGEAPRCPQSHHSVYARALELRGPVFVDDLQSCDYETGFEYHLRGQGMRAAIVQPLYVEGELVGVLELGSTRPGGLKAVNVFKLGKLEAIFALGLRRNLAELEDRVQSVIKQEYTAIHPVVEWRFRKAARERLRSGRSAVVEEIVFRNLSPLYGLTDIRGSSTIRNAAISADLRTQLELAKGVVCAAQAAKPQPALGEVEYRINRYLDSLHPGMATEDETSTLSYLETQVEPLFDYLSSLDSDVTRAVETYRQALDDTLGIVYEQRRQFEESVAVVNETVASVLQEGQVEGQALVPHYFELFKTDGVDYNVYVGSSLHEDREHDPLDLGNLRLWQLMTQIRVQWALDAAQPKMEVPLDVTHLVLVQSAPLAIRFRRDEHRFDVDGAYNIRYEIVKKRIDKALIRGSEERLTQPGTLAVAYSQEREAAEYRRYIDYLRAEGFVEGPTEELEVEDLQGVFGLRALRVRIAPAAGSTQEIEAEEIRKLTPKLALEA